jgi:hypothetical protein
MLLPRKWIEAAPGEWIIIDREPGSLALGMALHRLLVEPGSSQVVPE